MRGKTFHGVRTIPTYFRNYMRELIISHPVKRFSKSLKVFSYRSVWHSGNTLHVINTILGHYAHFWIFWPGSFGVHKKSSRLELVGSQNSFPRMQGTRNNTYFSHEYFCKYPLSPPQRLPMRNSD